MSDPYLNGSGSRPVLPADGRGRPVERPASVVADFGVRIEAATDRDDLCDALQDAIVAYGFIAFTYLLMRRGALEPATPRQFGEECVIKSTYPLPWRQRYRQQGYFDRDPVLVACRSRMIPMSWRALEMLDEPPGAREVIEDAREFGLASGFAVPVHTPAGDLAIVSLASDEAADALEARLPEIRHDIHLMVFLYHEHMERLAPDGGGARSNCRASQRRAR